MVHYKKKRPVLKSSVEIYKKSGWVKFKEKMSILFSNLKRFFVKIAYKIHEKGSQKLTIMLVPHSEKKIFNIQISNYILLFGGVVLGLLITTSLVSISNRQAKDQKMQRLSSETELQMMMIESFKNSIQNLNNTFTKFKADVNHIFKAAGGDGNIYNNFDDIRLDNDFSNKNIPQEAMELKKLAQELEMTKMKIGEMLMFKAQMETLLREIPSYYPLATRARITSPYGPRVDPVYRWKYSFHTGIDMALNPGTPVFAAADGVVVSAGWHGGYGLMVKINHKYGFSTKYAHLMKLGDQIQVDVEVKQGQVIGYVGQTGKATGPHLHYEVLIGEKNVNPQPFVSMHPINQ